jgi:hypothetical protein
MPAKKGEANMGQGRISQMLRSIPRTASNDDLYAPAPPDSVQSLDDLAAAVELARNELVTQEAELARAQQLHEDMKARLAHEIDKRQLGVTVTVNAGRRH